MKQLMWAIVNIDSGTVVSVYYHREQALEAMSESILISRNRADLAEFWRVEQVVVQRIEKI